MANPLLDTRDNDGWIGGRPPFEIRSWCADLNRRFGARGIERWYYVKSVAGEDGHETHVVDMADGDLAHDIRLMLRRRPPEYAWEEQRLKGYWRMLRDRMRRGLTEDQYDDWLNASR